MISHDPDGPGQKPARLVLAGLFTTVGADAVAATNFALLHKGVYLADFNHDTGVDFFDYDDFVQAFELAADPSSPPVWVRRYTASMPARKKPLARSLGEFFGILWDAAKTDVTKPPVAATTPPTIVRKEVQEKTVDTPRGPLTLRRTTIDEIEPPQALTQDTCSPQDPGRRT